MLAPMEVRIEPLSQESWPALAALFQQGGDAKWCWCNYWRIRNADWGDADAAVNRRRLRRLVDRDLAPGLVALDGDGQALGWVSLGPREEFARLEHSRVRPRLDDLPVWSIVCFVVGRASRRQGLEGRLLEGAIQHARKHKAPALEAYPVDPAAGGKATAATLYSGTLSTFLRAGFRLVHEIDSPQATVRRAIVRLEL